MKRFLWGALGLLLTLPLVAAPLTAGPNEAFVLLNNASVFKDKGMGNLDWQETVTVGDKVTILGGVVKAKYNGAEREYYKVKLSTGKEGFIRSNLLGVGGTLGVVKADSSFVYSEPRDVKITDRTIGRAQLVVVLKDGATDSFIAVSGYDEGKDLPFTGVFVNRSDVSINDVDVNAIVLLTVAKAQKNATIRKNLLTVAATKYPTSLFIDLINAGLSAGSPVRATKATTGTFTVNDANVNVRDVPNEKGNRAATLDKGASIQVTEVTTDSYTVDGLTAPWYHVQTPDGWVFGTFLTPAP